MTQDALLVCGNCTNAVALHDMKYNSSGDFLICKRCYNKEHNRQEAEEKTETKIEKQIEPVLEKPKIRTMVDHLGYERINFRCGNCGYRYSRKKDANYNRQCPYCGKFKAEPTNLPQTDEMLEEVNSIFSDVDSLLD